MSSRGLEGKGLECSGLKLIIKNILQPWSFGDRI